MATTSTVLKGEPRWPVAFTVVVMIVLTALLPDRLSLGPRWLLPTTEGVLLAALVFAEPRRVTRRMRPQFGDYLYLGLTNSVAFSPTDAMPLAMWAKAVMAVESLISLAILSLVVARAVNLF